MDLQNKPIIQQKCVEAAKVLLWYSGSVLIV